MSVWAAENRTRSYIRDLRLFDGNCQLGVSEFTVSGAPASVAELTTEMDNRGIAESLIYHSLASNYSPRVGNPLLVTEISADPRLHGCWVVLPHHTGELESAKFLVGAALEAGIRAMRMFPARHRFLLSDWSVNELLEELNEHRMPLFLDYDRTHWAQKVVDYDSVFRICNAFPELPLVLVREAIGSSRYLYPLLEKFDNLHLEISYYQSPCGLEDVSKRFGVNHLLFGSGLPTYEAGPVIAMLLCSEISSEERRMIAGDNLRGLLRAVRL
jgi:predicted TIM-barrel fold metal-dependent hydrolase